MKFINVGKIFNAKEVREAGILRQSRIFRSLSYNYDDDGHRTEIWAETHAGTAKSMMNYNSHGDPIERIDPLGHTIHMRNHYLDENFQEETDPLGRTTLTKKDALGRVIATEVKNPFGQTIKKVEYRYDTAGNRRASIETVISKNASIRTIVTEWQYDTSGRMIMQTEACGTPEQKTTSYTHYPHGKLKTKTKPDGTVLKYEYDAFDRLQKLASSDGSLHYMYHYDRNDNLTCVEDLVAVTKTIKDYDDNDRLIKETLANGLAIGYDYDGLGRLIKVYLPDQSSIRYQYEGPDLSKVLRIDSKGKQVYVHTYDNYDLAGNLLQSKLIGKTGKSDFTYDLCSRSLSLSTKNFRLTVKEYDPVGNLIERSMEDSLGSIGSRYGYDDLDQLILIEGSIKQEFSYDSLGNPVTINAKSCLVDSINQLRSVGQTTYDYDLNGNRILKKSYSDDVIYDYDARDRLSSVRTQNQKFEYAYDASNRRLSKKVYHGDDADWQAGQTVRYLYQGSKEIGTVDEQGRLVELRVLGKSALGDEIASAVALELQGEVFTPISDSHGNVISIVDAKNGAPFETYRYTPFGEEQIYDANGNLKDEAINPWRYASKRKDSESGLIYFGQRYFDPETCRWVTADPAGFIDGMNLYVFNHNNPLRYVDKDGHFAFLVPFFMAAFGASEVVITTITLETIFTYGTYALATGSVFLGCKYLEKRFDSHDQIMYDLAVEEEEKKKSKSNEKKPPYNGKELGDDPAKSPAEGFKWKGKDKPGSGQGSWHNERTKESLYPDLDHPPPIKPHWDYNGPDMPKGTKGARLNTDGTWEWK